MATKLSSVSSSAASVPFPTQCFIAGRWIEGEGPSFKVHDKSTLKVLAEISEPSAAQVKAAVASARKAFCEYRATPRDRARWLRASIPILERRREEIRDLIMAETGFTRAEIDAEMDRALITLELSAEEATRIVGETVAMAGSPGQHERLAFTIRVPLGVVCAITPFNAPLNSVLHKIAPALAAGNAVVLKPSAYTPLTAAAVVHVLLEAGVPPPLLTLVHGEGSRVGSLLLEAQEIDFYAFTGSTKVGRIIQQGAGIRRTQLELGSIASTIVCADADIDRALPKIANASFRKAGQVCTSIQRLYVQRDLLEEVTQGLTQAAAAMPAGDPREASTVIGPLISEAAAERVMSWLDEAVAANAQVLTGGTRRGPFVQPTVLIGIRPGMKVYEEEIFGPVVAIIPFRSLSEAIDGANDTPFGLAAGIFTSNYSAALEAAKRLRFGGIHINETSSSRVDGMPFGGVKNSGFGHEGPKYAIKNMTEERLITFSV